MEGKSVTRRALFPDSCLPGGPGCSGAHAFLGLLAALFPFETPGRLGVGNPGRPAPAQGDSRIFKPVHMRQEPLLRGVE